MSLPSIPKCYDPERAAAELPPDASQLKVVGHSLAAVASLPRRLANPPPRHSNIELCDVLADRHCSPISLVDFEHYLAFTEHSVENLYFIMWLRAYTTEYATIDHSDPAAVALLSDSVVSAAHTYIEPNAPYEINLNDGSRSSLLALSASPPPPPAVYDAARKEVQWLLIESVQRWEKIVKSNAGWRRLAFSTYLGLANACVTTAAIIIARVYMHNSKARILAACLIPWLWFAIIGVICGLKGVCLLCYTAGGTVRQVSSFELSLPRTSPSFRPTTTEMPTSNPSVLSVESPITPTFKSGASQYPHDPKDPFSPHSQRGAEFIIEPTPNLRNRPNVAKVKIVEFWAPMVKVEDPLIVRAYWETVVGGFLWALVPAICIGVLVAAI